MVRVHPSRDPLNECSFSVFNSSNRFIKNYQSDATTEIINRYVVDTSMRHIGIPLMSDPPHRVEEIAKKRGISMAQVAVAWCLSKEGVTAPIVGTTKLENLQDIIGGLSSVGFCGMDFIGGYRCIGGKAHRRRDQASRGCVQDQGGIGTCLKRMFGMWGNRHEFPFLYP